MGRDTTKLVFEVSDKTIQNSVSSATETSWKIEFSPVVSFDVMLFKKLITKVLISLCGCAG